MSWNVEYRYAALELQEVKSSEALLSLLQSFASSILQEYRETESYPECMDDVFCDMEQGKFSGDDETIKAIADVSSLYLINIKYEESGTFLLVRSE
jgi:hypothetical protein